MRAMGFKWLISALLFHSIQSMGAPLFTGLDVVQNTPRTLPRETAHGQVLVFLSTKCPCSKSHEAPLKELAAAFPQITFTAIHANQDESLEQAQRYFTDAELPFPVLRDEKARLADELGAYKTPHVYVFDATGNRVYSGGVDDSKSAPRAERRYLKETLVALMENKKLEFSQQRTLGCEIQR